MEKVQVLIVEDEAIVSMDLRYRVFYLVWPIPSL